VAGHATEGFKSRRRLPTPVVLDLWLVLPVLLMAAVLYSSVGHGGATLYLAVLTLAGYAVADLATTVLAVNIVAAGIAFFMFQSAGHLRLRLLAPLAATSVPMAFVGGLVELPGVVGAALVGSALLLASARFLVFPRIPDLQLRASGWVFLVSAPLLGAALGFLAGATGIGGGIFLSPVLVMMGWADVRQAGTVAAAFIVLNSASGLAARVATVPVDWSFFVPVVLVVAAGALVGSLAGSRRLDPRALKVLLGLVLLAAGLRALVA
jgi:hypothetical protein